MSGHSGPEPAMVVATSDGYLPLRALAAYSGLSVRTLRRFLRRERAPLPHFQVDGGKVLVKRSEFDLWLAAYRRSSTMPADDTARHVDALLSSLTPRVRGGHHAPYHGRPRAREG